MTTPELDDRLADLLITYDVIAASALDGVKAFQAAKGCTLSGALVGLCLVPGHTLDRLLEELTGVRAVDPSLMTVSSDFVRRINVLIPPEITARLLVFPAQMEVNALHVCMLNPTDGWTIQALESVSGCRIVPFVAHESALITALEEHYRLHVRRPIAYASGGEDEAALAYRWMLQQPFDEFVGPALSLINRRRDAIARDPGALEALIREADVIRLVQQIVARAVELGASDIHIEPIADALRVRLRIDGAVRIAHTLPAAIAVPVVARLKAMADLPIRDSREPLDGHIAYQVAWGRNVDLRLSLLPSATGETIVLRALDRSRDRRALADLGMDSGTQSSVEAIAGLPNGLLLVTGPTGCGKSSTLYALLDQLNDEGTCIVTAEDPVESRIAGVTQVSCHDTSGVTFAAALRGFLRQDPDVMMVGEIRDAETADIALKSALTGHLVLSTLHTNDAPGAILRLINMDLEPFLIASALRMVVAQRLIRRLCLECRRRAVPGSEEARSCLRALPSDVRTALDGSTVFEPAGCHRCDGTGYRGRTGIFEVLTITDAIQELIIQRASAQQIRAVARAEGMRTLRDVAMAKVIAGETSIVEALEHTMSHLSGPVVHATRETVHV